MTGAYASKARAAPGEEPPMTNLRDEQLMLDAAAAIADLLWSWAAPHSGGAKRTNVRDSKVENCTGQAYAPPRCQIDAWHNGGLVPTGDLVPGVSFHYATTMGPSVLRGPPTL